MIMQRKWFSLAGRDAFNVIVGHGCGADPGKDCATGFVAALAEIENCGVGATHIVRSRIWARGPALRRHASDARLKTLAGDRRGASASFIAPERLPAGIDVLADIVALSASGEKHVREYEPVIAPPMFVRSGELVFLSGNTDMSATSDEQLARICANIASSLAAAGAAWTDIVQVDAYIARTLDWAHVKSAVNARFPGAVTLTTVEGYSAPEKLIEIEVTANLASA